MPCGQAPFGGVWSSALSSLIGKDVQELSWGGVLGISRGVKRFAKACDGGFFPGFLPSGKKPEESRWGDSNPRPTPYQGVALPPEPQRHIIVGVDGGVGPPRFELGSPAPQADRIPSYPTAPYLLVSCYSRHSVVLFKLHPKYLTSPMRST